LRHEQIMSQDLKDYFHDIKDFDRGTKIKPNPEPQIFTEK